MAADEHVDRLPHRILKFCPCCGKPGFAPRSPETFLSGEQPSNEMSCPCCGFVLYVNAPASTAAIIHRSPNELLLGRRIAEPKANTLDLPGGFVSPRETAEDAVRRELWEEFNLRLSVVKPYHRTYWNEYDTGRIVTFPLDIVFVCEVEDWTQLRVKEPDEVVPCFVHIDELDLSEVGLDSIRRILADYKREFLESRIR